jgi:hypothetical protein
MKQDYLFPVYAFDGVASTPMMSDYSFRKYILACPPDALKDVPVF